MIRKLQVTIILLCMMSSAEAGTVSIGTASARGDMRVDNYPVKGNATLFDGSVVQTGSATANLHLNKGADITLSTESRGTLYSDRIVLQQGETELASSGSFKLEANGLRVTPTEAHSRAVVSVKPGNTVEVASLTGSFGVTNDQGVVLANVLPGRAISFAMKADANPNSFSGVGMIAKENGTYYLITDADVKYLLTCRDPHKFEGDKVVVSGTLQTTAATTGNNSTTMLCLKSIDINGATGLSTTSKWIIAGILVGAGAGIGIGLATANSGSPAASR